MEVYIITKIPENVWKDFYQILEEGITDMDDKKMKQWRYDFFSSLGYKSSINNKKTLFKFYRYMIRQGKIQSENDLLEFNRDLDPTIRLWEKDIQNISRSTDWIQPKSVIQVGQKDIDDIIRQKDSQIEKLKEKIKKMSKELHKSSKENTEMTKKYRNAQEIEKVAKELMEKEIEIKNLESRLANLQEIVAELEKEKVEMSPPHLDNKYPKKVKDIKPDMPDYTYPSWWERINLFSDPFPSTQGLNKIDKEFYDDVVLRTEIFNRYLYLIRQRHKEILNNIVVVYGEYGSGKTTFFQYLERPLLNAGILPIYLMVNSDPSTEKIRKEFHGQFLREAIDSNPTSGKVGYLYPRLEAEASIEIIRDQLEDILTTTDYEGFIIFIDGLHKEAKHSESVLGFIKMLQNDFEYLSSFKNIPISFMIAGCLDWKRLLKKDPYLTGSKSGEENIPDISYLEAFDLINMRFKAFSVNKEEPFQLKEDIISKIWSNLKKELERGIVPRDMIDHVRDLIKNKLEGKKVSGKFSISLTDIPLKITPEILRHIRFKVANNPHINKIIYSGIEKYFGNDKDGFRSCLEDFVNIHHVKKISISESGKIDHFVMRDLGIDIENIRVLEEFNFLERKDYLLQRGSTVSKTGTQKLAKETYKQKFLKVDKNLEKFIENIEDEMDLQIEDYIQEIYKTRERTIRSIRKEIRESPDKTINTLNELKRKEKNGKIRIIIDRVILDHNKILEHQSSVKGIIPKEQLIEKTSNPTYDLLRLLLFSEENLDLSNADNDEVKKLWDSYWIFCDDYFNFESQINRIEREHIQVTEKEDNRIVLSYKRAFEALVSLINDLRNCDKILRINYIGLTNKDKRELHSIRLDYLNDEYLNSAKKLIAYFEPKIQVFIQNCLEIRYGSRWRRRLPPDVNKRIEDKQKKERENSRILFQEPEYLLCNCDFDDYKGIMTENSNWNEIFKFLTLNLNLNLQTLKSLYDDFRELRNKIEHNNVQWLNKNHHKIKKGMEFVEDLFESFHRLYYEFLLKKNMFYERGKEGTGEGYIFFSFKENRDRIDSYKSVIRFSELNRFAGSLKKKGIPEIHLELTREEGYEYGLEFRKYISYLAFLIFHDYIALKEFKNGNVILDLRQLGDVKDN